MASFKAGNHLDKLPFDEIKVADFSAWVAGPLVTKTLADYGATVVLVESVKSPPNQRTTLPFKDNKTGVNRSGMFAYSCGNKYGISIDLKNLHGVEVAKKLVSWADIVVENFSPGVMENFGLGYEILMEINPDIIMLRASAQGQTGPKRSSKALGLQLSALSGFPLFTGMADGEPLSMMFAYPDYIVAFPAIAALVSAMDYRLRTGIGQVIDISQYEACINFLSPYLMEFMTNNHQSQRNGNRHPSAAPHGVFRCLGEDSWCTLAVFNDKEWVSLRDIINNNKLNESRFDTALLRKTNEEELNKIINEWTIQKTAKENVEILQSQGITSGMVQKGEDIYQDPQLNLRNFFWKLPHPEMGEFTHLGQPSLMSLTPAKARMPAPCLGEHTEKVCREFLGLTENEFAELLVAGAFGF